MSEAGGAHTVIDHRFYRKAIASDRYVYANTGFRPQHPVIVGSMALVGICIVGVTEEFAKVSSKLWSYGHLSLCSRGHRHKAGNSKYFFHARNMIKIVFSHSVSESVSAQS